jgi:hypothetical protein
MIVMLIVVGVAAAWGWVRWVLGLDRPIFGDE